MSREPLAPATFQREIEAMKERIYALEQLAPKEVEKWEFEVVASYALLVGAGGDSLTLYTPPWRPYNDCVLEKMRVVVGTASAGNLYFSAKQDGSVIETLTIPAAELVASKVLLSPAGFSPASALTFEATCDSIDNWGAVTVSAYFSTYTKQYLSGGLNFRADLQVIN